MYINTNDIFLCIDTKKKQPETKKKMEAEHLQKQVYDWFLISVLDFKIKIKIGENYNSIQKKTV